MQAEAWVTFSADLIAEQTSAAGVVGAVYGTQTDFTLNLRFLIGVANVSGTATEVGNITAYVALKFWS